MTLSLGWLPSSILAEILHGSDASYHVLRLWQCGDRLLNAKLSSALTFIDLRADQGQIPLLDGLFPQIVFSEFKNLQHLVLHGNRYAPDPKSSRTQQFLHIASRKVETLDLAGYRICQTLLPFVSDGGDEDAASADESAMVAPIDMKSVFPILKTLRLAHLREWSPFYNYLHLSVLPSTLTELSIPRMSFDRPVAFMASLPRSLEVLTSSLSLDFLGQENHPFSSETFWQDPPPRLRIIDQMLMPYDCLVPERIYLPKTLETLGGADISNWPISIVQQLPPALQTLDPLSFASCSVVTDFRELKLPEQLTSLGLIVEPGDFPRIVSLIPTLPPTLTEFDIIGEDVYDYPLLTTHLRKGSSWPPALKSLEIGYFIPHTVLTVLPDSLTQLSCSFSGVERFPSNELPRSLKSLFLVVADTETLQLGEELPSSLDTLHIDSRLVTALDPSSFKALPHSLTTLILERNIQLTDIVDSCNLPAKLSKLTAKGWKMEWFSKLPSSLTDLKLTDVQLPSTLSAGEIESEFMKLPMGLERLDLSICVSGLTIDPPDFSPDKFHKRYQLRELSVCLT